MSSAFPVTGCVYCKHKHTHLSHTCLAPSHPHSYPYPHTQTQTDTPGKLSARPRQSPRDAPRGGWGREGVVFPSIVKQRGTWILMLQPSSGMSALSLPRISQLSSCPEPFLQGWPRQCSVSALSRFLLNGEAQSWEMFLKKKRQCHSEVRLLHGRGTVLVSSPNGLEPPSTVCNLHIFVLDCSFSRMTFSWNNGRVSVWKSAFIVFLLQRSALVHQ